MKGIIKVSVYRDVPHCPPSLTSKKSWINCKWITCCLATFQRIASSDFAGSVAHLACLGAWRWHLLSVKPQWPIIFTYFIRDEAQQDYKPLHTRYSCWNVETMLNFRFSLYAVAWEEDGGCGTISHVYFKSPFFWFVFQVGRMSLNFQCPIINKSTTD